MTEHKYEEASGKMRWAKEAPHCFPSNIAGGSERALRLQQEIVIYDVTQPYLVEIGREWRDVPIEVEA